MSVVLNTRLNQAFSFQLNFSKPAGEVSTSAAGSSG